MSTLVHVWMCEGACGGCVRVQKKTFIVQMKYKTINTAQSVFFLFCFGLQQRVGLTATTAAAPRRGRQNQLLGLGLVRVGLGLVLRLGLGLG